jgi:hypothetical protein
MVRVLSLRGRRRGRNFHMDVSYPMVIIVASQNQERSKQRQLKAESSFLFEHLPRVNRRAAGHLFRSMLIIVASLIVSRNARKQRKHLYSTVKSSIILSPVKPASFDTEATASIDTEATSSFDTEATASFDTEAAASFDTEATSSFDTEASV